MNVFQPYLEQIPNQVCSVCRSRKTTGQYKLHPQRDHDSFFEDLDSISVCQVCAEDRAYFSSTYLALLYDICKEATRVIPISDIYQNETISGITFNKEDSEKTPLERICILADKAYHYKPIGETVVGTNTEYGQVIATIESEILFSLSNPIDLSDSLYSTTPQYMNGNRYELISTEELADGVTRPILVSNMI